MINQREQVLRSQYEDAIAQIDGVVAVRIALSDEGSIANISILAGPERLSEDIIDEVLHVLLTQFGVDTQPKYISVTQDDLSKQWESYIGSNSIVPVEPGGGVAYNSENILPRFRLLCVNTIVTGLEMEVSVQIAFQGEVFEGTVKGPKSSSVRLFMVAAATLQAVSKFLGGKAALVADEVVKAKLAQKDSILASVTMITEHDEETLLGSVFVKDDENEAVSKAALDAINRRIMMLAAEDRDD